MDWASEDSWLYVFNTNRLNGILNQKVWNWAIEMDNLQGSKSLQKLGLNEKNQWILYDEKPKAFFEHINMYIDNENILSEQEQKQYEELCASGQYLEGDALTDELKALESHFPGILTIDDGEIDKFERELEFLEKDTQERKDRIKRMEETEKRQLRDIEANDKKHFEFDYQGKHLQEQCFQKASALMELQKSNQKKVVDLKEVYIQPVNMKISFDDKKFHAFLL